MINTKSIAQKVLNIVGQMHGSRRPRVVPTEDALSSVLEEVFWSSVDRYEGNPLRVRIYFAPQQALSHESIVQLGAPLPFSRDTIRKLSPAHPPDGALLVVEDSTAGLQIVALLGSSPFARGGSPAWLCIECRGPSRHKGMHWLASHSGVHTGQAEITRGHGFWSNRCPMHFGPCTQPHCAGHSCSARLVTATRHWNCDRTSGNRGRALGPSLRRVNGRRFAGVRLFSPDESILV